MAKKRRLPPMETMTLGALAERLAGCQKSEEDERERVHARLGDLEALTRSVAADLTFLRGRMSGWWGVMMFLAAGGGVTGGIVAVVKAVGG
jgi:hypothetical protein